MLELHCTLSQAMMAYKLGIQSSLSGLKVEARVAIRQIVNSVQRQDWQLHKVAAEILPEDMLKADTGVNPDFAGFVHVFVPYCSGDSWVGQAQRATNPFVADTNGKEESRWTGYFQGHLILEKVLETVVPIG